VKRRDFFGVAAATSVAAATGGRSFARTLDRPTELVDCTTLTTDPYCEQGDADNLIIRLYYQGEVVHTQVAVATVTKIGDTVHYGALQDFVMDFIGSTDDCAVSLVSLPEMERHVGYGDHQPLPLIIRPGNTLTIQGSVDGILRLT